MSQRQLRIGYLTGSFPAPTHTFFWREIQALRELGAHVDIVSTRAPPLAPSDDAWRHEAMKQTTYLLPLGKRHASAVLRSVCAAAPAGWLRTVRSWLRADGSLRDRARLLPAMVLGAKLSVLAGARRWDHVHVGFTEQAANIALYANRLSGLRYSVSQHHSIAASGRNQREKWFHAAFGSVVSTFLLKEVTEWSGGQFHTPVVHVPHGIDPDFFRRQKAYKPWDGEGECRLFSCGRLIPAKGHMEAVRALGILRDHGIRCRLRIAGSPPTDTDTFAQELLDVAAALGIRDQIELLGPRTQAEIRGELEEAHVMVLATHIEGWGSAIAEAVAMGTPTVACRTGGVVDTITPGENGLLADPGNPESLAECIERILRQSELARLFSARGPVTIGERFERLAGPRILLAAIQNAVNGRPVRALTSDSPVE